MKYLTKKEQTQLQNSIENISKIISNRIYKFEEQAEYVLTESTKVKYEDAADALRDFQSNVSTLNRDLEDLDNKIN